MKLVILLWLIFNVFESVKTEIRHHQQQQQRSTEVTLPPWLVEDEKRITKSFRDTKRYWTVDFTRFLHDKEDGDIRGRRNDTVEANNADNVRFPSSDAFRGTTPLFGPTKGVASPNRAVTTLPTENDKSVTAPRAESLIAARKISENEECNEKILDNFLVSDHLVADAIIADRDEAEKLANLLMEMTGGRGQMRNLIENTMEKHPNIVLISTAVTKGPEKTKLSQTVYRKGGVFGNEHRKGYPQFATSDTSYWTPLFQDCLTGNWMFGFSYSVRDGNDRSDATVYFAAESVTGDVDQCNPSLRAILNGGPKCEAATTKCVTVPNSGFTVGGYKCSCRPGYYFPDTNATGKYYFPGSDIETAAESGNLSKFRCIPCPDECHYSCNLAGECIVKQNDLLRYIIISVQVSCIFFALVLTAVVFKHRKCKTIATGMWTILEMILVGSIILYSSVLIRSFDPSTQFCLFEPWCREIGFIICYGAIILKLYRILIEFRTRKAHRAVVRDKDLLKYLSGMVAVVFAYMAAWTATSLNMIHEENYSMLTIGLADEGRIEFYTCKAVWWDYVTETAEILVLIFGVRLSYASRNATSQFQERRFLSIAISIEAAISTSLYILRFFFWDTIHPDLNFLVYFIRSQLTTTLVLILVFLPKWWYQQFHVNRSRASRNYLMQESGKGPFEAFKPQDGVTATNSDVEGEISLADMNPEDIRGPLVGWIRVLTTFVVQVVNVVFILYTLNYISKHRKTAELKRLYTELEVLKNKTIRLDNPHISKRRGGRKIAHRRFSLQALSHQTQRLSSKNTFSETTEAEPSRTPEDSVCSNEGPSIIINDGPSDIVHMTPKKNQK